jgi:hypothetical protein
LPVAFILSCAGCGESPVVAPTPVPADPVADVQEAVFLQHFGSNLSGLQQGAAAYCIGLADQRDPDPAFLLRFRGHQPPVKKRSDCVFEVSGVRDLATGRPALVFDTDSVTLLGENDAEATGAYFEGGLSAGGSRFRLARRNGRWEVTDQQITFIS